MKQNLLLLGILCCLTSYAQCWQQAAAGYTHTIALKDNGSIWAWGQNDKGQLGIGNTLSQSTPVLIGTEASWVWVGAGNKFSVALKADGTLWTWGANDLGQLGNGTTANTALPAQVGTDADWSQVAVEGYHIIAVKTNGTLWAWGLNLNKQLGDNTGVNKTQPVQIGTDSNWLKPGAGVFHSAAIKTDKTLWTWGNNGYGQLGSGSYAFFEFNFPVKVSLDTNWSNLSLGAETTLAVKENNSLWGSGANIGAGVTNIQPESSVIFAEASYNNNYIIKPDGTLWAIGENIYGQIGNGGQDPEYYEYTMVNNDTDWVSVSGTLNTIVAIKDDGTLWMWGDNTSGQISASNIAVITTPMQVECPISGLETQALQFTRIYPNPATDVLYVENTSAEHITGISITDALGKMVLQQYSGTTVNVSGLSNGVYFIAVSTPSGKSVSKFVKQ